MPLGALPLLYRHREQAPGRGRVRGGDPDGGGRGLPRGEERGGRRLRHRRPRRRRAGGGAVLCATTCRALVFGAQKIQPGGTPGPYLLAFGEGGGYKRCKGNVSNVRWRGVEGVPVLDFLLSEGGGSARFEARLDVLLLRRSGGPLPRPRSRWLQGRLSQEDFALLARLADDGQPWHERYEDLFLPARAVVTLDRTRWAEERGFDVKRLRIPGLGPDYAKDDLLIGRPL
mmetsp:Transcript_30423/g.96767  ORF Transcript_30423/g.96767 Transcript_30423/m.96767 type:complete len:229 (+) Transcript_30423:895-1581(+)